MVTGIVWVFLGISAMLGLMVFRIGRNADWSTGAAVLAALIPVAFTFFMGLLGLCIAVAFTVAVWKANG